MSEQCWETINKQRGIRCMLVTGHDGPHDPVLDVGRIGTMAICKACGQERADYPRTPGQTDEQRRNVANALELKGRAYRLLMGRHYTPKAHA